MHTTRHRSVRIGSFPTVVDGRSVMVHIDQERIDNTSITDSEMRTVAGLNELSTADGDDLQWLATGRYLRIVDGAILTSDHADAV